MSHFFVERQSLYFILDSSFEYYWQYEKCVEFICDAFEDLDRQDWFGLRNLGCQSHNILLENVGCNISVKRQALVSLHDSIEDYHG